MKRSDEDIDRLLHDWHRVAATAAPPTEPAELATRRTVRGGSTVMPASLGVVAIAVIAVVALVGRPGVGPAAGDVSPSAPAPSPSAVAGTGPVASTVQEGGLSLTLAADREVYREGDAITAAATVEYLGPDATREVVHAYRAAVFSVAEVGGGRSVAGGSRLSQVTTVLERGVPVMYPWEKSGGTTGDPEADAFFAEYMAGDSLRLPAGTWDLSVVFGAGLTTSVRVTVLPAPTTAESSPTVAAPTPAQTDAPLRSEATQLAGPFELYLAVPRTHYVEGEDIVPLATLTWAGEGAATRLGHGPGVLVFSVREVGGDRIAEGGSDSMCVTTRWTRDEAQTFAWSRSGGWSPDEQTATDRFVQAYVQDGPEGGLRLPAGMWDLVAAADLYGAGCEGEGTHIEVSLRVRVAPRTALLATPAATPAEAPGPDATVALGPVVRCGQTRALDCEGAIALVRARAPDAYDDALLIVVDDNCDPTVVCDRYYPFDSTVALVPQDAGADGAFTAWVRGIEGPDEVVLQSGMPAWVRATIEETLEPVAIPPGAPPRIAWARVPAAEPAMPAQPRTCRLARVGGTLAESVEWGLGFLDGGEVTRVIWPFGYSMHLGADGPELIDSAGEVIGRVGDRLSGTGGWGGGDPPTLLFCGRL